VLVYTEVIADELEYKKCSSSVHNDIFSLHMKCLVDSITLRLQHSA